MRLRRLVRHGWFRRARSIFPSDALAAVRAAAAEAERKSGGVIRFVAERGLPWSLALADLAPRERACRLFASLRLWDTDRRNAVLIHVLAADRSIEIVADRAWSGVVAAADWESVCGTMQTQFRARRFKDGAIAAVEAVAALLALHFPAPTLAAVGRASRSDDPLPHQSSLL